MDIKLNDEERNAIMDEIAQYAARPTLEDHEFTAAQYADRTEVSIQQASGDLIVLLNNGILNRRKVWDYEKCSEVWAYSKMNTTDETEEN